MTPKTFSFRTEGYWEHFELKEKIEWERIRWLATIMLQPHTKKGRRLKPQDLMKFEWEKGGGEKLSKKELKKRKLHAEFIKKKYSKMSRDNSIKK